MLGDFPPSSRVSLLRLPAEAWMIRLPTAVEPVKKILSTSGCSGRADPAAEPSPVTMLRASGGKPASRMCSPILRAVSGVCSAGFQYNRVGHGHRRGNLANGHDSWDVSRRDPVADLQRLAQGILQERGIGWQRVPNGQRHRNAKVKLSQPPSSRLPLRVSSASLVEGLQLG